VNDGKTLAGQKNAALAEAERQFFPSFTVFLLEKRALMAEKTCRFENNAYFCAAKSEKSVFKPRCLHKGRRRKGRNADLAETFNNNPY